MKLMSIAITKCFLKLLSRFVLKNCARNHEPILKCPFKSNGKNKQSIPPIM